MSSSYPTPTGTIRVDFESAPNEARVSSDVPSHVIDNSVRLVKLEPRFAVRPLTIAACLSVTVVSRPQTSDWTRPETCCTDSTALTRHCDNSSRGDGAYLSSSRTRACVHTCR